MILYTLHENYVSLYRLSVSSEKVYIITISYFETNYFTMVYLCATFWSSTQPWASPNERIPRQFEGWSCFMRKLQQTSMTWVSCKRHAAASKFSMVSSLSCSTPKWFELVENNYISHQIRHRYFRRHFCWPL